MPNDTRWGSKNMKPPLKQKKGRPLRTISKMLFGKADRGLHAKTMMR